MSQKFHINKHGVPAPCRATKGNCPLGGEGEHFDSAEQAQEFIDNQNEESFGILPSTAKDSDGGDGGSKGPSPLGGLGGESFESIDDAYDRMDELLSEEYGDNPFSTSSISNKFPNLNDDEVRNLKEYLDLEESAINDLKELNEMDKGTGEYYNRVQEMRARELEKYKAYKNVPIDDEQLKELIDEKIPVSRAHNDDPRYVFDEIHPEITDGRPMEVTTWLMSSYSGKPQEQVESEVRELADEKGISLHDANFEYWRGLEQRTDKPFVVLDLETANPVNDKALQYDEGQLTYIIEMGAVKVHPDGRTEEMHFMYDVPSEFKERHGTGFSQFHNITPDMVEGHKKFDDKENQKRLMEFLDGSVLSAHNSYFEEKQLSASLEGFGEKVKEGNIEMFCTRNFTRFFVPEAEKHNNHKMVEAAGMEYEGGHRALNDARMSHAAFEVLKKNR